MEDKDKIKKILREFSELAEDKGNKGGEQKKGDSGLAAKHGRIQSLLSNNIFNHAGIMDKMEGWDGSSDTDRSLFGKKLNMEENEEGTKYHFTDEELSKIVSVMMDTSKEIRNKVGKTTK